MLDVSDTSLTMAKAIASTSVAPDRGDRFLICLTEAQLELGIQ
jgi:hypothetical protein